MSDRWGRPAPLPDVASLPSRQGAAARALTHAGQGGAYPGAASVMDLGGSIQIAPWYRAKFSTSVDWQAYAANITVAASATTTMTGFTYTVPVNMKAVIKQVTVTIQSLVNTSTVTWRLRRNGGPIQGYNDVLIPPGTAGLIVMPYNEIDLLLDQGDILTAQMIESGGTAYTASLSASGWATAMADIQRLQSGLTV